MKQHLEKINTLNILQMKQHFDLAKKLNQLILGPFQPFSLSISHSL